jgi:hypothetical protein
MHEILLYGHPCLELGGKLALVALLSAFFGSQSLLLNSIKVFGIDKEISSQVSIAGSDRELIQVGDAFASQEQVINEVMATADGAERKQTISTDGCV